MQVGGSVAAGSLVAGSLVAASLVAESLVQLFGVTRSSSVGQIFRSDLLVLASQVLPFSAILNLSILGLSKF